MPSVPVAVPTGPMSRARSFAGCRVADDARTPALVVGLLTAFVAWRWALPAVFGSLHVTWDAAGHLSAAATVRDRFWPWPTGWDPGYFGGWPQGRFYPPLTHWLVATLGKVAPIEIAFASVVGAAAVATPYAAYRFARGRRAEAPVAALFSLFFTAVLAAPPEILRMKFAPGGTFHSTFEAGLVTNGVGLLIFLMAGASFPAALSARARVLPAALWLALAVCNHLVAGAATAALFLADAIARSSRSRRRKAVATRAAIVAFTGAALSSWWWAPMLFDDGYRRIAHVAAETGPLVSVTLALALSAYAVGSALSRPRIALVSSGAALFASAIVFGSALGEAGAGAAHFYRFATFAAAGALLPAASGPSRRNARLCAGIVAAAFLTALAVHSRPEASKREAPPLSIPNDLGPEDRLLTAAHTGHEFSAHFLAFETPRRSGAQGALGLFVESSPLSGHWMELARATVFDEFSWGVPINLGNAARLSHAIGDRSDLAPEAKAAARARMKRLYDVFGVTHLVTNRRPSPEISPSSAEAPEIAAIPARAAPVGSDFEYRDGAHVFRAYPIEPRPLFAEVVTRATLPFDASDEDAWDKVVEDALFGEEDDAPLPVAARPGLDATPGEDATVRAFRDPSGLSISIEVDAPDPRPVVVKTAWHRNWTARTEDGVEIPVDRIAPGFCLLRANGRVDLRWRRSAFERGAAALSVAALGLGLLATLSRRTRNPRVG
jgi:hypothetical protein